MSEQVAHRVCVELEINRGLSMSTEEFHKRATELMDQLMSQEETDDLIADSTVSSDAGEYAVTVELLIFKPDPIACVHHASSFIRTALHTLGATTAGWPDADALTRMVQSSSFQTERTLVPA